ncbi:MAG: winged helix family transcriptional regulator [Chloroflexi bacterium]|nr:MAG: winged helix family transcriptional regulator [Chloroflexota bacterium]
MVSPKAVQNYPETYRSREVNILSKWLLSGISGTVISLPGAGRNNLLNFLCYRPDVLQVHYLEAEATRIVVVPVDLSNLPENSPVTMYRAILRAFYWQRHRLPSHLQDHVTSIYAENRGTRDPFIAQTGLYELLLGFQKEALQVTLVFNRFEQFAAEANGRMFTTLRSLRDTFKEILAYIVGMHREIIYLPNREALGELYPLLDNNVCWISAMNDSDSRWVIEQALYRVAERPSPGELNHILALSGGLPVLLRFITSWWVKQSPKPPLESWTEQLLSTYLFDHRLKELWQGLTQEEKSALLALGKTKGRRGETAVSPPEERILQQLAVKGVCHKSSQGWQINSLLWAAYIHLQKEEKQIGKLTQHEKSDLILQASEPVKLAPQEATLLSFLLKHPYERHTYETLILMVWANDHDPISQKQSLHQLIRAIRLKIEPNPSEPLYLITWRDQDDAGYQLFPEGQPL